MPYKTNQDLPDSVIKHLPIHAQDIYREAFNHALEEYSHHKEKIKSEDDPETVAH